MDVKITNAMCDCYWARLLEVEAYTSQLKLDTKMLHTGLCGIIGQITDFKCVWYDELLADATLFTARLLKKLGFMPYLEQYTYSADYLYIGGVANRGRWTAQRAEALDTLITLFNLDIELRAIKLAELGVEVLGVEVSNA